MPLLTLDEEYLLTAAPPDPERGVAPLSPRKVFPREGTTKFSPINVSFLPQLPGTGEAGRSSLQDFLTWHQLPQSMALRKETDIDGSVQFSSVHSLSHVRLFVTPWTAACQASLSITSSRNSLRLMFIESVMPSSHLILCRPLLLLPPFPPSIKVFSNESTLRMRWPKYWKKS